MTIKLTSFNVEKILLDCLYKVGEVDNENLIMVTGIMNSYKFQPDKLALYKENIKELLDQLPFEFMINGGGGWSFLNAYMTKTGEHWGEHRDIENLLVLGLGTHQARYVMPKEMWAVMPGGMPYFAVL